MFHLNRPKSTTDKIIVLDLDNTLISTCSHMKKLKRLGIFEKDKHFPLRSRIYYFDYYEEGHYISMWGVMRPHMKEFLEFCFEYFEKVIVFSAGATKYVIEIVNFIFKDTHYPDEVYTRDHLDYDDDNRNKPLKDLGKLFENKYPMERILIVDDNKKTYKRNPDNAIAISAYEPSSSLQDIMRNDDSLLKIMKWFQQKHVKESDNVMKLSKQDIFI